MSLTDPAIEPLRARVAALEAANATLRRDAAVWRRRAWESFLTSLVLLGVAVWLLSRGGAS